MPCYQVQTVSVEFHVAHVDLLEQAVRSLGWSSVVSADRRRWTVGPYMQSIAIDLDAGKADVRIDQRIYLNQLKRAYSQQAVKLAAKLGGWQLKSLTATKGQLLRGVL